MISSVWVSEWVIYCGDCINISHYNSWDINCLQVCLDSWSWIIKTHQQNLTFFFSSYLFFGIKIKKISLVPLFLYTTLCCRAVAQIDTPRGTHMPNFPTNTCMTRHRYCLSVFNFCIKLCTFCTDPGFLLLSASLLLHDAFSANFFFFPTQMNVFHLSHTIWSKILRVIFVYRLLLQKQRRPECITTNRVGHN